MGEKKNKSEIKIKEKYPYLAHWKERGFDKFPIIPPVEIIRIAEERILESFRRSISKSSYFEGITPKEQRRLEKQALALVDIKALVVQFCNERVIDGEEIILATWRETMGRILEGESRDEVLRDSAKKLLPKTKGGPFVMNENRRKMVKRIYGEMKDCIKFLRRLMEVPLINSEEYSWGEEGAFRELNDIKLFVPDVLTVFEEKELASLDEIPSIKDIALKIIARRLRKCSVETNPRHLQDLIYKTKLTS